MEEDEEDLGCIHLVYPKESCRICYPKVTKLTIKGAEEIGQIRFGE